MLKNDLNYFYALYSKSTLFINYGINSISYDYEMLKNYLNYFYALYSLINPIYYM